MSGVLNAIAGNTSVERLSQTISDLGSGDYGAPSFAVSLRGNTVFFLKYDTDLDQVTLQLSSASPAQSFFGIIRIEDATPGTFQAFASASATYSLISTTGQWVWSTAALWSAADIGEVKRIEIYL